MATSDVTETNIICSKKDVSHDYRDDDGTSSLGEYIDSPEQNPVCENDICADSAKKNENSNQTTQERKTFAAIEGELDFEDEVKSEQSSLRAELKNSFDILENEIYKTDEKSCQRSTEEAQEHTTVKAQDNLTKKKDESIEEGEDDGEISDEDDLEEGEVKDSSPVPKTPTRQVCRFFNRGQCTWGNVCRFLHLSASDKGNYNMFAPSPRYSYGSPVNSSANVIPVIVNPRTTSRGGPDFIPAALPIPPPPPPEPTVVESAWERGLKEAKELVKRANKRKAEEPDFEEKRLNLSINVNEKNVPEYDKENEYIEKPYRRPAEINPYKYEEPSDAYDNGDREAREHWRGGRYENFEIRWTRQDMHKERRDFERSRGRRASVEREKRSKRSRSKERWRDERLFEIQMRTRADEWVDPWRRSKTPKGGRRRSRSGSYSSVSSYSYSDRSSRSSCSYTRSSSRSSCGSSRSPSFGRKRKPSPMTDMIMSPKGSNRFAPAKKKLGERSSSSRSRSLSRTPSISRSRSYSRSLSMDSVSSASSSASHSSSASESHRNRDPHSSDFRKQEEKNMPENISSKTSSSGLYDNIQRMQPYENEGSAATLPEQNPSVNDLSGQEQAPPAVPFPNLRHLLPNFDRPKEPVRGLHKQQIKLTLLNKPPVTKVANLPLKMKPFDRDDGMKTSQSGTKQLSPQSSNANKTAPSVASRKSALSRRDELLKQLKAVEDAIARKRAKFD